MWKLKYFIISILFGLSYFNIADCKNIVSISTSIDENGNLQKILVLPTPKEEMNNNKEAQKIFNSNEHRKEASILLDIDTNMNIIKDIDIFSSYYRNVINKDEDIINNNIYYILIPKNEIIINLKYKIWELPRDIKNMEKQIKNKKYTQKDIDIAINLNIKDFVNKFLFKKNDIIFDNNDDSSSNHLIIKNNNNKKKNIHFEKIINCSDGAIIIIDEIL